MLKKFKNHIKKILPQNKKLIVGVSGGVDSIVLCELLLKTKINFSIAHVNYKLRNSDSEKDELFVKNYSLKNNIKFYVKTCNLSKQKNSIQEKSRTIRYNFFKLLCSQYKYHYILTAHHLDDNIETILMNIYREKKTDALIGIRDLDNNIVRPMLTFSKNEIIKYANNNHVEWREDKSNSENKYLRNKIRNILVPKIESIDPLYRKNFMNLIKRSNTQKKINDKYLKKIENEYFKTLKNGIVESKKSIWMKLNIKSIEFILFRKYGFFKNSEIIKILSASSGKRIFSKTHEIASNRNSILIKKISKDISNIYDLKIGKNQRPFNIIIEKSDSSEKHSKNNIFIDTIAAMPLRLRKFKNGDFFYPYGMKGKKKVSKFFKDEKLSIFEKQKKWILTDANNQILWVVGMRVDRRLIKKTGECLKISI